MTGLSGVRGLRGQKQLPGRGAEQKGTARQQAGHPDGCALGVSCLQLRGARPCTSGMGLKTSYLSVMDCDASTVK